MSLILPWTHFFTTLRSECASVNACHPQNVHHQPSWKQQGKTVATEKDQNQCAESIHPGGRRLVQKLFCGSRTVHSSSVRNLHSHTRPFALLPRQRLAIYEPESCGSRQMRSRITFFRKGQKSEQERES